MPIHDWTRVKAGIFHHFHVEWIGVVARVLNQGLLPPDHYALAEQVAGDIGPDVLALRGPSRELPAPAGTAVADAPPKVRHRLTIESDIYAEKARVIAIRHTSDDSLVAMLEVVSPGNKSSRQALRSFVEKAAGILRAGVHVSIIDLFPPGPRDPEGIHRAICDEFIDTDFVLDRERPLTLASYSSGLTKEAYVETVAVGEKLPDMPLFLTPSTYILLPLESTYCSAWEAVPDRWRRVLEGPTESPNGMR
jgi:Protein of unknown function (DUF4058)